MPEPDYLARFRRYSELFYSYFPATHGDRDMVILRGHQLIESLVFRFLQEQLNNPEELDNFRARWDSSVSLVKALRSLNKPDDEWAWQSTIRLERARNQVAHYLEPSRSDKAVSDFLNCVRGSYGGFRGVPGEDELKKAIFIVYFCLSKILALEEFPPCTATHLVREEIARDCQILIGRGIRGNVGAD